MNSTISVIIPIRNGIRHILAIEEHQKSCGVGSAILEQLSDLYADGIIKSFPRVKRLAIDDLFIPIVGDQSYFKASGKSYLDLISLCFMNIHLLIDIIVLPSVEKAIPCLKCKNKRETADHLVGNVYLCRKP